MKIYELNLKRKIYIIFEIRRDLLDFIDDMN